MGQGKGMVREEMDYSMGLGLEYLGEGGWDRADGLWISDRVGARVKILVRVMGRM